MLTNADKGDNWFHLDDTDPTLNRLAGAIANAVDRGERAKALREAQHYVLEQGLFIPTAQLLQRVFIQTARLQGDAYSGAAYPLYHGAWLAH